MGGWGWVREGRTTTPPPLVTTKLKIYPSNILQNQPYCTNLQLKITGACPKLPNLRFPFTQRQISLFKRYFTGCQINFFWKYPSNPKFDPLFKNFWARACIDTQRVFSIWLNWFNVGPSSATWHINGSPKRGELKKPASRICTSTPL